MSDDRIAQKLDRAADFARDLQEHAAFLLEAYWKGHETRRTPADATRLLTDADLLFRNAAHILAICATSRESQP